MGDLAKKVAEDFSQAAAQYNAHARWQYSMLQKLLDWQPDLAKYASVLDAGCATGRLADEARERGYDWRITGSDIAWRMCQQAKQKMPIVCADLQKLPFASTSFDVIISALCLQWVEDVPAVLAEFARVTKLQSEVLISVLVTGSLAGLQESFGQVDAYPHTMHFRSAEAVLQEAQAAGFSIIKQSQLHEAVAYPSMQDLVASLRAIGANNKNPNRRRGLMTRRSWERVERHYMAHNSSPAGILAHYNVLFLHLKKGAA